MKNERKDKEIKEGTFYLELDVKEGRYGPYVTLELKRRPIKRKDGHYETFLPIDVTHRDMKNMTGLVVEFSKRYKKYHEKRKG